MSTYAQRLLDPRWQRRRLEILNSNHVDCLCDVRHFDSRDVDALGEGYTIRAPDDDR